SNYAQIRDNGELYSAIVEHEHLPAVPAALDDAQKLTLYRAFKKLRALVLQPSGTGHAFDYTVEGTYMRVSGTVAGDGTVSVASRSQGSRPNCPICLSAATHIATPAGDVVVTAIHVGTLVWTQGADGSRVAAPVIAVGSTPVPAGHLMVHGHARRRATALGVARSPHSGWKASGLAGRGRRCRWLARWRLGGRALQRRPDLRPSARRTDRVLLGRRNPSEQHAQRAARLGNFLFLDEPQVTAHVQSQVTREEARDALDVQRPVGEVRARMRRALHDP